MINKKPVLRSIKTAKILEEDSDSSLDSIEKDELKRKLQNMAHIIKMWRKR